MESLSAFAGWDSCNIIRSDLRWDTSRHDPVIFNTYFITVAEAASLWRMNDHFLRSAVVTD